MTQDLFTDGAINIQGARENNLKNVDLSIPKHQTTVFVGLSGAGKSSLVFDTLAAVSRRELNETFPSFTQQYLPKYGQPDFDRIDHLPVAIVVEQKPIGRNSRSTLATYTGIYSVLRLLFSRVGKPWVGYSEWFSFNLPQGMCPNCQGLGFVDDVDERQLIDPDKSLNEGAMTFAGFQPGTWRWNEYGHSGLFDLDKKIKDYSPAEYDLFMHAPQQKLKNPPVEWGRTALYEGLVPRMMRSVIHSASGRHHQAALAKIVTRKPCPVCHGTRLNPAALKGRIQGKNIAEVGAMDLVNVISFLDQITDPVATGMVRELRGKVQALIDIGLGYLSLDRGTDTLSGGEAQRIKIAKYLTSSLSDLVYILDEPSVGLHPHDIQLITKSLAKLKAHGNTIVLVDHNPAIIQSADYVVEIGPQAGKAGGQVTFTGTYSALLKSDTITGKMLRTPTTFRAPRQSQSWLNVDHVTAHNLHQVDAKIPEHVMTVVSGPAGAGKSTLVAAVKQRVANRDYIDLSQDAVGINIRSTPATYLHLMNPLRKLFSEANGGVSPQLFSYNGKGACPRCKGKGVTITEMAFMDPVVQVCELCGGKRYSQEALQYQYHGQDIAAVLDLSIQEAFDFFADVPAIAKKLALLNQVGLGYLSLNQAMTTLSGGEVQRVKLAMELDHTGNIYFLDEPTTGLHLNDTQRLIRLFEDLVAKGNTLILIEHNLAVISQADWLIDMGPDAGKYGGRVCYEGTPQGSLTCPDSRTGMALKQSLTQRG
ncbi:ATP-binding cassette domain-containing protein [Levilactobacillus acidifarinae]|uniref:UvrABC system protein A n=1 Tax=Levilactobacillus acidifarinae DSM 19394 = JCM 15949 TaxID=1423715 RepID=A0A0R1LG20_9LACO|nr:excinuclease ABC subunit UvrA [Levilactobacillus acidifarinae]KRK94581.1 UvrA [Levilactobacillus acidifarinae DSM 19394]GEO68333.1 excinuclease ABC subunit A [Levilactobacillus acidifarinae]